MKFLAIIDNCACHQSANPNKAEIRVGDVASAPLSFKTMDNRSDAESNESHHHEHHEHDCMAATLNGLFGVLFIMSRDGTLHPLFVYAGMFIDFVQV